MHSFVDSYTVAMTALFMRNNKWFKNSVDSPGFEEQLSKTTLNQTDIDSEGFYEVKANSPAGTLDPAYHVAKWRGPGYPTIIYHHGNNESPFNYGFGSKNTFKSVLYNNMEDINANLISLRAAFHNDGLKFYSDKMSRLSNFTGMLTASVKLIETLVQSLKRRGCSQIIITGLSLGGWVTNLHRSFYNTADIYIPIFAGASLDELFLTSSYKKLASDLVKENQQKVRVCLNFEEEFARIEDNNVFPLLALYDQFIVFDVQKRCYEGHPIAIIKKGHITGALASKQLRQHILSYLPENISSK
ncbi:MAG TPA: hypothetical protein PLP71_05750 [Syntrophomonadaceae bacterium]|nr:hypothetical protein [Syntrophomonadaceae bacterium]HQD90510.1 hypothetical protein [Syntrophomonadaceae bacterium]